MKVRPAFGGEACGGLRSGSMFVLTRRPPQGGSPAPAIRVNLEPVSSDRIGSATSTCFRVASCAS